MATTALLDRFMGFVEDMQLGGFVGEELTHANSSLPNYFKPSYRNEGVGVFTPGAQFLCVLSKISMASGLQTTG